MKKLSVTLLALSLLSLMSIGAYGYDNDLKEHVTLHNDLLVGNTMLKKGDYLVRYNAATSQASFRNLNKNEVAATVMAIVTVQEKKAESDTLYTRTTLQGERLTKLALGGQREELAFIEPVVIVPAIEVELIEEITPLCYWEPTPLSDDMEEIVVSEVDGMLPEAETIYYKLVCQPRK